MGKRDTRSRALGVTTAPSVVCINDSDYWRYLHTFSIQGRMVGTVGIRNGLCTGSWFQDIKQVNGSEKCAEASRNPQGATENTEAEGSEFTKSKGNFTQQLWETC